MPFSWTPHPRPLPIGVGRGKYFNYDTVSGGMGQGLPRSEELIPPIGKGAHDEVEVGEEDDESDDEAGNGPFHRDLIDIAYREERFGDEEGDQNRGYEATQRPLEIDQESHAEDDPQDYLGLGEVYPRPVDDIEDLSQDIRNYPYLFFSRSNCSVKAKARFLSTRFCPACLYSLPGTERLGQYQAVMSLGH
jgi:hypothetical protein